MGDYLSVMLISMISTVLTWMVIVFAAALVWTLFEAIAFYADAIFSKKGTKKVGKNV